MGYIDRSRLLPKSEGSIYKLVNLAAKRAWRSGASQNL